MEKHRKVQVIIMFKNNATQQTLLLQTKDDRGNYWQSVTGSVDSEESWEDAAKRELFEETGIKAQVSMLDLEFFFHDRWKRDVHEKVFYALSKDLKVKISSEEHQAYKWINTKVIKREDFGQESNYKSFLEVLNCIN